MPLRARLGLGHDGVVRLGQHWRIAGSPAARTATANRHGAVLTAP